MSLPIFEVTTCDFYQDFRAICIIYRDIYNGPRRGRSHWREHFPKFPHFTISRSRGPGPETEIWQQETKWDGEMTADNFGISRAWKLICCIEFQRCTSNKPTPHFLLINLPPRYILQNYIWILNVLWEKLVKFSVFTQIVFVWGCHRHEAAMAQPHGPHSNISWNTRVEQILCEEINKNIY